jgi:hypothetical protein
VKPLEELTDTDDPAIALIHRWVEDAENDCEILPPFGARDRVLMATQVTTHATMGALA